MRKIIFIIAILCIGNNLLSFSQVVNADESLLDISYGWPPAIFEGYENGFGPLAIKYEYLVAPKVGMGGIVNFTSTPDESFIRVMAKFSFHFGNSDKFDGYSTIAAGTTTQDYEVPVSGRVGLGGRLFFSPKAAALMEFGVGGGGIIEFGLSFKF